MAVSYESGTITLDNPPANSLSPAVIEALQCVWDRVKGSGARALR